MHVTRQELYVGAADPATRVNCDVVAFGNLLFLSGCGPLDEHGAVVGGDDVRAQARQVLANLGLVLATAGASLADVLQLTVYLTRVDEYRRIADLRREAFAPRRPASTLVEVSALAVPGMRIEIAAVAGAR